MRFGWMKSKNIRFHNYRCNPNKMLDSNMLFSIIYYAATCTEISSNDRQTKYPDVDIRNIDFFWKLIVGRPRPMKSNTRAIRAPELTFAGIPSIGY